MAGPTTEYSKTALPLEYSAVPVASQPMSDIENHYNKLVRGIKEIWACINGAAAGVDINGTTLADFSTAVNLGILPRLVDIEDSGKINDSAVLQLGAALNAGNRGVRFTLGNTSVYSELQWNNTTGVFVVQDQTGALKKIQGAAPTANNDYATKQYVDGLLGGGALRKLAISAPPVKTSTVVVTVDYFYVADSDGAIFITSSTPKTCTINTTGLGGIASSQASKGINGTISVASGNAGITGVNTSFTTDFQPGDNIVTNGNQSRKILSITNNTTMTATTTFSSTENGVSYIRGQVLNGNCAELFFYWVGDAAGINSGLFASTRNTTAGETLVDLPSQAKTGSVNVTSGGNTITGSSTAFLTEFAVGQEVVIAGSSTVWGTISEITSNTSMKISGTWGATLTGAQIRLSYNKYRSMPFVAPVNSSFTLHDFSVTGFPWASQLRLTLAEGTSDFALLSSITTTSTTAANVWLNSATQLKVPNKMCRRIYVKSYVGITSFATNTSPGQFNTGPTTGTVAQKTTSPSSQLYNSGSNVASYTNNNYYDLDLDSSGNFQYRLTSGNATAGLDLLGYYFTEWKG